MRTEPPGKDVPALVHSGNGPGATVEAVPSEDLLRLIRTGRKSREAWRQCRLQREGQAGLHRAAF